MRRGTAALALAIVDIRRGCGRQRRRGQVVPPPAEVPQGAILDPTELLHKLGGLRDAGLLTSAEFEAKKSEVLARL
jgi:hypothetical protein